MAMVDLYLAKFYVKILQIEWKQAISYLMSIQSLKIFYATINQIFDCIKEGNMGKH